MSSDTLVMIFFGGLIGMVILAIAIGVAKNMNKKNQKSKVESVERGMPEEEMLRIMGKGYNRSLLKNNRVKYEWRYSEGSSVGYSYKGMSTRQYHGVRKATIYCKDGVVEEVKPFNM